MKRAVSVLCILMVAVPGVAAQEDARLRDILAAAGIDSTFDIYSLEAQQGRGGTIGGGGDGGSDDNDSSTVDTYPSTSSSTSSTGISWGVVGIGMALIGGFLAFGGEEYKMEGLSEDQQVLLGTGLVIGGITTMVFTW